MPLICSFHNTLGYGRRRKEHIKIKYLRHLLPDAEKIHAVSQGVANSIVSHIPAVQNKVATILNPIPHNVASLSKQSINHKWLSSEPRNESNTFPKIILAAGRLTEQKNFLILIRAFAEVRSQLDARLILLGDGPQREKIYELISSLNIEETISMPGWVDNPYSFMASADLFVMSSSWEGCPNGTTRSIGMRMLGSQYRLPVGPKRNSRTRSLGKVSSSKRSDVALAEAITATLEDHTDQDALRQRAMQYSPENYDRKIRNSHQRGNF